MRSLFEAVKFGEFGSASPQQVGKPVQVLRGTAKLAAVPVVTAQTGALKGAGGAAKPMSPGMPKATPGGLALAAKKAAMPGDKNLRNMQRSLGQSIDAFREIEAIVEAQLGSDPVALKAAYRRQQERNTKIDRRYPGAREASRTDEHGRAPYHTYAYGPGAERPVGKLGRIALHPDHPSKAARAYEKGRARTTALYARRVAAQEK